MEENNKFNIKDGLSIDEAKVSVLIILCVFTFLFGFVMYVLKGDFSDNLALVMQTLIFVIGGVNISNAIMTVISKKGAK